MAECESLKTLGDKLQDRISLRTLTLGLLIYIDMEMMQSRSIVPHDLKSKPMRQATPTFNHPVTRNLQRLIFHADFFYRIPYHGHKSLAQLTITPCGRLAQVFPRTWVLKPPDGDTITSGKKMVKTMRFAPWARGDILILGLGLGLGVQLSLIPDQVIL